MIGCKRPIEEKNGGDNVSPKEGDKSADELLLALLYALDKLPVNLDALTACNVGKSVNHLRGHKNSEIQKKARGLVDTWKKRVDAEMTMLELTKLKDEKSTGAANPTAVSLSGKPGSSDLSQGVSKRSSAEALPRNLISQHSPSCKSLTGKSHSDRGTLTNSYRAIISCFFLSLRSWSSTSIDRRSGDDRSAHGPLWSIEAAIIWRSISLDHDRATLASPAALVSFYSGKDIVWAPYGEFWRMVRNRVGQFWSSHRSDRRTSIDRSAISENLILWSIDEIAVIEL